MQSFKKLSLFISFAIVVSVIGLFPTFASADELSNGLTFSLVDDSYYEVIGYEGTESEIYIPDQFNGMPVLGIGTKAFALNQTIAVVVMPNTIKYLGDRSFANCKNLHSVVLSEELYAIEDNAFNGCSSLTSVMLPESLNIIGSSAFRNCNALVNIQFNSDFISVGYDAFTNTKWYDDQENGYIFFRNVLYGYKGDMPSDEILNIDDSVTCIAECALKDQMNLSEVIFTDNIDSIGWGAFANTGIKQLIVPNITTIEESTFADCKHLNKVTIPNTVDLIDFEAFARCTSLSEINFDDDIECNISMRVFDDCPSLIRVQLPKSIKEIGQATFGYINSEPIGCEVISVPIDGFIIEGYKESAAETYANENGFTFIALDDQITTTIPVTTTTEIATTTTTTESTTLETEYTTTTSTNNFTEIIDTTSNFETETTTVVTTTASTDNVTEVTDTISTSETETTTTTVVTNYKNITAEDFINWAKNDYQSKTGITPANAVLSETSDGYYEISLVDDTGNVLDIYTVDPVTATGTNQNSEEVNLPQTGYSNWYHTAAALAACVTVIGGVMVIGSGVLKKKR